MSAIDERYLEDLRGSMDARTLERIDGLVERIVRVKEMGGNAAVATGHGPNIHEGVTTLIAHLIERNVFDGVITSSAVVAHEMAGSLDRVKRVDGRELGVGEDILPRGEIFEATIMDDDTLSMIEDEMTVDTGLIEKVMEMAGEVVIKAAGNMGYPMGLRTERLAVEVEGIARSMGRTFEYTAGLGAHPMTMIGAGAHRGVPVIVSAPQLIGGGQVGLSIGDSVSFRRRSALVASILAEADLIIESGIDLSQEIHDGPLETYTGHGIWSAWEGMRTFSLKNTFLARIDLDDNPERLWEIEKSVPIVGDLGVVWPLLAYGVSERLRLDLDFISYPRESEQGADMRNWIVDHVGILDRRTMIEKARRLAEKNSKEV